jgi:hypothetical protein
MCIQQGSNSLLWCAAGRSAADAARAEALVRQLKVGAAVAVHLQVALLCKGSCDLCAIAALEQFPATHAGTAKLMHAVCVACTQLVSESNETASLIGMENAFQLVGTACRLAAHRCRKDHCRLPSTITASGTTFKNACTLVGSETNHAAQGEGLVTLHSALTEAGQQRGDAAGEHLTACARAAHEAMVKHSDQNVCMAALKALKVSSAAMRANLFFDNGANFLVNAVPVPSTQHLPAATRAFL